MRAGLAVLIIGLAGCTRGMSHPGEINCDWAEQDDRTLNLGNAADRRHLRHDAIVAEDLAIGHADSNVGRKSAALPEGYDRRRDRCMASLFSRISARHGIGVDVVAEYRLRRNRLADTAVIGTFGLLYLGVSYLVAGRIVRRFQSERLPTALAVAVVSVGLAWAGMMLGEVWSILIEVARLGRGHLSYRTARIPWVQHRATLFVIALIAFHLIAAFRYRFHIAHDEQSDAGGY